MSASTSDAATEILAVLENIKKLEAATKLRDQSSTKFESAANSLADLTSKMATIPDSLALQCDKADDSIKKISNAFNVGGTVFVQLKDIQNEIDQLKTDFANEIQSLIEKHNELTEANQLLLERLKQSLELSAELQNGVKTTHSKIDKIQATMERGFFKRLFG